MPTYKVLYWPTLSSGAGHCGVMESELTSEPHALLHGLREDIEYNTRVQVLTGEVIIEGPKSDSGSVQCVCACVCVCVRVLSWPWACAQVLTVCMFV